MPYHEKVHSADLSYEIRGPHHRRFCLPSLAARPGADQLQGRRSNVQSFTRKCAAVSPTTCCCCRSARPTDITLWWHQSSDGAICQDVQQSVTGRSWLQDPASGTLCRRRQRRRRHSLPSVNDLNPGFSGNHIRTLSSEPAVSTLYN